MSEICIINYGDSQGEVWDYIFYHNKNYIKYFENNLVGWRSGWSLKGINKPEHKYRLTHPVVTLDKKYKTLFILLTFGSVDIEWNLSYKRYILNENPNIDLFLEIMIQNYVKLVERYLSIEKEMKKEREINFQIIVTFPFLPLPLSDGYMNDFSKKTNTLYYEVISHEERLKLWNRFCDKVILLLSDNIEYNKKIYIFDIRQDFYSKGFNYFQRKDIEDHHPDFVISQESIINLLKSQQFLNHNNEKILLSYKNYLDKTMYSHKRRPFII